MKIHGAWFSDQSIARLVLHELLLLSLQLIVSDLLWWVQKLDLLKTHFSMGMHWLKGKITGICPKLSNGKKNMVSGSDVPLNQSVDNGNLHGIYIPSGTRLHSC